MPYEFMDNEGNMHPYRTLKELCRYAYTYLKRSMDKWGGELDSHVIWDKNGNTTGMYVARICYRKNRITYLCNKNGRMYRVKSDGSYNTLITPEERALIYKVENNPKNW